MIASHVERVLDVLIAVVAEQALHAQDIIDHVALFGTATVKVDAKIRVARRRVGSEAVDERLAVPERGREDERTPEHVLVLDARVEAEQATERAATDERVLAFAFRAEFRVHVGFHVV